jgi:hypothetical protein
MNPDVQLAERYSRVEQTRATMKEVIDRYNAHMSPVCTCSDRSPGFVQATMKRHEDDDRIWYDGTSCDTGSRLWHELIQISGIQLTSEGDLLTLYPGSDPTKLDDSDLSCCVGIHFHCHGWMDVRQASETNRALVCRSCHLRVSFPAIVKTWGDLRRWSATQLTEAGLCARNGGM